MFYLRATTKVIYRCAGASFSKRRAGNKAKVFSFGAGGLYSYVMDVILDAVDDRSMEL